jgi:Pyridoxamine 5'-phosphate oxidase
MSEREPVEVTNLDIYGSGELKWSRARDQLVQGAPQAGLAFFLGTTGPDGRPHSAGFGPAYFEGDLYIVSGPATRKSRDLAANPAATVSARLKDLDLVLEGAATRVTDRATLEKLAAIYRAGGWPAEVKDDAFTAPFSAPSAGPPPWHVFRFTWHTAVAVATAEPHGATRWRFKT